MFENLVDLILGMIISASPIGELKLGLPFALFKGVNPFIAWLLCCCANTLCTPILFFSLDKFNPILLKIKWYKKFAIWFSLKSKRSTKKSIQKYGFLGLMIVVLLPIPGTGAYTGALGSFIFNMDRKKSFFYISLGCFISGAIILVLVQLGLLSYNAI